MKSDQLGVSVFRDFERLYKLVSFYQGDERQLTRHVMQCDNSLGNSINLPEEESSMIKFDFLMTAVFADGQEVFRANRPELTMYYALFCEGVKSIIVSRGISGRELLEWCGLLREHLRPGLGFSTDLASVLWRNKFNHIKIQVYNALMNVDEIGMAIEGLVTDEMAETFGTELDSRTVEYREGMVGGRKAFDIKDRTQALDRAKENLWALPSAGKFFHTVNPVGEVEAAKLKSYLSDVAYSDKARALVKFHPSEVEALRGELEAYDANHIEFNLFNHLFSLLEANAAFTDAAAALLTARLAATLRSVIKRFHTGLILFSLRRMIGLKGHPLVMSLITEAVKSVKEALSIDENRRLILEAFDSEEGSRNSLEILSFLPKAEWYQFSASVVKLRKSKIAEKYLEFLVSKDPDFERNLWSIPTESLSPLLSSLVKLKLDPELLQRLLNRALGSKSPDIVKAALPFVAQVKLTRDQGVQLLLKLADHLKAGLFQKIIEENALENWRQALGALLQSGRWFEFDEEAQVAFVRAVVQALKQEALRPLNDLCEARRWKLFPRFPQQREAALVGMSLVRDSQLKRDIAEILRKQSRVLFQSADLKRRLAGVS